MGKLDKIASSPSYQPLSNEEDAEEPLTCDYDYLQLSIMILKIILWCLLMTLFVILEFGAVFFVISVFYVMFTNFRKSKKSPDELSAYSVFNPNCESIKGTLTGQQFENEIRFGLGAATGPM